MTSDDDAVREQLIGLRRKVDTADSRCEAIRAGPPTATTILAGAEIDYTELKQTRAQRLTLVGKLIKLWATAPAQQRTKLRAHGRDAARRTSQAETTAA